MAGLIASPAARGSFESNRLIAALLVLFSHSYALLQQSAAEPLHIISGGRHDFGKIAVYVFFAMSGYLVTLSWQRDSDVMRFLTRRALRVFPGLMVVIAFSALLLGPAMTRLAPLAYFTDPATWTYLAKITSYPMQHRLPGVFADNPYAHVVNGSLWSLRLEVTLYLALAVIGSIGLLGRRWFTAAMMVGCLIVAEAPRVMELDLGPAGSDLITVYGLNTATFFIGVLMAQSRIGGSIAWMAAAWLMVAMVAFLLPNERWLFVLCFAPAVVLTSQSLNVSLRLSGDYSYGIYLWAFPVQQCLIALYPSLTPLPLFALALPITTALAVASWHLVERHALAFKPSRAAVDQRVASAASA